MNCKICQQPVSFLFRTKILQKHDVQYFKCSCCGFIQTEEPFWLEEAYKNPISIFDVGLVYRNLELSKASEKIFLKFFNCNSVFLDYAGGYGLYVRLMRDKGFDFYWQDVYCENIFAKYFDSADLKIKTKYELVTSFEVFEHLTDPLKEVEKLLEFSDSILLSTELQPQKKINNVTDWWYFVPEQGQHISFYTVKSFELIAQKIGINFYTNNNNLHLLSRKKFSQNPVLAAGRRKNIFSRALNKVSNSLDGTGKYPKLESYLHKDFEKIKELNKKTADENRN